MPTLYLNGYETEAKLDGERLELSRINHEKNDIDVMHVHFFDIERVVVIGRAAVTMPVLHKCFRAKIPVYILSSHGGWLGTFHPGNEGNAARRLRQYDLARDPAFALNTASRIVNAKIRNQRRVLQRLAANREESAAAEQLDACNSLQTLALRATEAPDLDTLRGLEGYAAATYFRRLAAFFPATMPFTGRSRRPPKDAANALLSWAYTIVLAEIEAALRTASLDPGLGFLHEISLNRPSLALDLLEPLRAPLCDLLVMRIVNHQMLTPDDFEFRAEDGGTYLKREARKTFFIEYEKTMTRRFAEAKNAPHTDFRNVIRDQTDTLLRAMENRRQKDDDFFIMP